MKSTVRPVFQKHESKMYLEENNQSNQWLCYDWHVSIVKKDTNKKKKKKLTKKTKTHKCCVLWESPRLKKFTFYIPYYSNINEKGPVQLTFNSQFPFKKSLYPWFMDPWQWV